MSTAAASYRDLVEQIIGPMRPGEKLKGAFGKVARATGLSPRRVRSIWNNEITDLRGREVDALRAAAARREGTHDLETIAADFEALAERVAALAARGDRETADRMGLLADRMRRLASGER